MLTRGPAFLVAVGSLFGVAIWFPFGIAFWLCFFFSLVTPVQYFLFLVTTVATSALVLLRLLDSLWGFKVLGIRV